MIKSKRVCLKPVKWDPKGNPPKGDERWFIVTSTKNVIDPLPGDVINTTELGHLVNKASVDVVVRQ